MREGSKKKANNTSTTHFRPSSVVSTGQNIYEWSVPSEERRQLMDCGKFESQFIVK